MTPVVPVLPGLLAPAVASATVVVPGVPGVAAPSVVSLVPLGDTATAATLTDVPSGLSPRGLRSAASSVVWLAGARLAPREPTTLEAVARGGPRRAP